MELVHKKKKKKAINSLKSYSQHAQLTNWVVIKERDGGAEDLLKHLVVQVLRGVHGNLEEQQRSDEAKQEHGKYDGGEDGYIPGYSWCASKTGWEEDALASASRLVGAELRLQQLDTGYQSEFSVGLES